MSAFHLVLLSLVISLLYKTFSKVWPPTTICVNADLENKGRLWGGGGQKVDSHQDVSQ